MYQRSYGETHFPEGFDEGLGFAHTSDNLGPQSVPQTVEVHREVARAASRRRGPAGDARGLRRDRLAAAGGAAGGGARARRQLDPRRRQRPGEARALPRAAAALRRLRGRGARRAAPRLRPRADARRRAHLGRRHQELPARRAGVGPPRLRGGARARTTASPSPRRPGPSSAPISTPPSPPCAPADRARAEPRSPRPTRRRPARSGPGRDRVRRSDGWRIEIAPDTGDVRAITSPPAARAGGAGRQPDRLPPRELRRRRRRAAHGQLSDAPRRMGGARPRQARPRDRPAARGRPPSRRCCAGPPARSATRAPSRTCRAEAARRLGAPASVETRIRAAAGRPPAYPPAPRQAGEPHAGGRVSLASCPRAPASGASARPASGSRPRTSPRAAAASCKPSSPPRPGCRTGAGSRSSPRRGAGRPGGRGLHGLLARAPRFRPGHPLQPLQQQVGHELPDVVGG